MLITVASSKEATAMPSYPLAVNGTGLAAAFGPIVTTDARVRDAKQAAPPRGHDC